MPPQDGLSPRRGRGDTKHPGSGGKHQGKAWLLQTALISLEDVSESCTRLKMSPIIIMSHSWLSDISEIKKQSLAQPFAAPLGICPSATQLLFNAISRTNNPPDSSPPTLAVQPLRDRPLGQQVLPSHPKVWVFFHVGKAGIWAQICCPGCSPGAELGVVSGCTEVAGAVPEMSQAGRDFLDHHIQVQNPENR